MNKKCKVTVEIIVTATVADGPNPKLQAFTFQREFISGMPKVECRYFMTEEKQETGQITIVITDLPLSR